MPQTRRGRPGAMSERVAAGYINRPVLSQAQRRRSSFAPGLIFNNLVIRSLIERYVLGEGRRADPVGFEVGVNKFQSLLKLFPPGQGRRRAGALHAVDLVGGDGPGAAGMTDLNDGRIRRNRYVTDLRMTRAQAEAAGAEGARARRYQRAMGLEEREELARRVAAVRLCGGFDAFAEHEAFCARMDREAFFGPGAQWRGRYDFVIANLVLHYAFSSEATAAAALRNVAACLAEGGVAFGITVDGAVMAHRAAGGRVWSVPDARGGTLCRCEFGEWDLSTPFGHTYDFELFNNSADGGGRAELVSRAECAVYYPVLVRLAAAAGLEPLDHGGGRLASLAQLTAHDWEAAPAGPPAVAAHDANIMEHAARTGMRLAETRDDGTESYDVAHEMDAFQWELLHMYSVFAFAKPGGRPKRPRPAAAPER